MFFIIYCLLLYIFICNGFGYLNRILIDEIMLEEILLKGSKRLCIFNFLNIIGR